MKSKYQKMMNDLSLSEAFSKNMEGMLNSTRKRSRPAFRITLIAACVAILAVTTGLAISQRLPDPVSVINEQSGKDHASYAVRAELERRAITSLSSQLQADLGTSSIHSTHYSKEALEEYLGFDLINCAGLENAGIVENLDQDFTHSFDLMPELAVDTSARYVLSAQDNETLKVSAHRVVHNTEIFLAAYVCIGETHKSNLVKSIIGESFKPVKMMDWDFVYDENGNYMLGPDGHPLITSTQYESAEHEFHYEEYTMPNGCCATIVTATVVERDRTKGFKEYMGYFIYDGILYTIKPYAIYDPYQSFPMNDYDCLAVLYEVLDLFE